ncbi:hypothetical protein J2853_000908 [Streptosporangium lutulentum]|uniref:Uncharacterized protein n=2 Tax=Streptosporangium lutulentum TaxID=1461250 RepID=A0ABT9Q4N2_9ACTN|nr:hypothetical protein [Streptosporangium lutulentum]MDP9841697.1 hypothetical protein [Streptosporangium lutulentum]
MSKVTRRLATATATLAITGGILFAAGGAASAATTYESGSATGAAAVRHEAVKQESRSWDGHRWWNRYSRYGDLYLVVHGDRYRFDGDHFYKWHDGKWKRLTNAAVRRLGFDRGHLSGHHHHGHGKSGHDGHGK